MRTLVLAPVSLVLFLLIASHGPAAAGEARLLSGCLTREGSVVKLTLGDAPNRPCANLQVRLSLDLSGLRDASPSRLSLKNRALENRDSPVDRAGDDSAIVLRLHFPF